MRARVDPPSDSGPQAETPLESLESIVDALDEPAGRATFLRGLVLGALVGAAIAGSVVRARRSMRHPALPTIRSRPSRGS